MRISHSRTFWRTKVSMSEAEVSVHEGQGQNGDEGQAKRRNSMERYRPGAYFNEEREKLRRRAHFGERRLAEKGRNEGRNHGKNGRNQGPKDGRNQGRSNGQNGGNFARYRSAAKSDSDFEGEPKKADIPLDEVKAAPQFANPPTTIGSWADEVSDSSPEVSPKKAEPEVTDLREKLNSMRMGSRSDNNGSSKPVNASRGDQRPRNKGHNEYRNQTNKLPMPKRNTVNFEPSHEPALMRILAALPALKRYNRPYQTRDVVMVTDLFCQPSDLTIFTKLMDEIEHCGVDSSKLWQLWHGDSHVIADDSKAWKKHCPTFSWVVESMADYFGMDVKATRMNWYRNPSEWKPFHHDAAAMKEKYAKTQNFTVAVSFGAEREAAFEHAQTKTIISMPQPNGAVYTFGKDVNILWRHGIPQLPPNHQIKDEPNGRISIIAWGWIPMEDVE